MISFDNYNLEDSINKINTFSYSDDSIEYYSSKK